MSQLVGGGGAAKVNIDKVTDDLNELGKLYPITVSNVHGTQSPITKVESHQMFTSAFMMTSDMRGEKACMRYG
jgi:hypothetical protein